MKAGDLVRERSGLYLGIVIESRSHVIVRDALRGVTTEDAWLRGKNLNIHHIYWGDTKVKKNPAWVKERDLVKAV